MPTAIYKSGATTLPVWPTCQSLGAYPESTAADGEEFCRAQIISTSSEIRRAKEEGFSTDCSLVLLAKKRKDAFDWGGQKVKVAYLKKNNKTVSPSSGYTRMIISNKIAILKKGDKVLFMGPIPKPVEVSPPKKNENLLP
jgi:hypothetical protein